MSVSADSIHDYKLVDQVVLITGTILAAILLSGCGLLNQPRAGTGAPADIPAEVDTNEPVQGTASTPAATRPEETPEVAPSEPESRPAEPDTASAPALPEATQEIVPQSPIPQPEATEEALNDDSANKSPDGSYLIAVQYTVDESNGSDLPENYRSLLVVATVANSGSSPIEISPEDLLLQDQSGNQYTPSDPSSNTQPALVGAQLDSNESLVGLVRFAIPLESQPQYLLWCPAQNCSNPLRSIIP